MEWAAGLYEVKKTDDGWRIFDCREGCMTMGSYRTRADAEYSVECALRSSDTFRTPRTFTLECERRDDGGLRMTCPQVPGLILSSDNMLAVFADAARAIDAIMRHNLK